MTPHARRPTRNFSRIAVPVALAITLGLTGEARADTSTGSPNCSVIVQAAAASAAARIQSDDTNIRDPMSVTSLTCLDGFFKGIGLDLVTNLLDPTALFKQVQGKICSSVSSTLRSLAGSAQCGLTITGFNLGFGVGLGGGTFCPKISIGGGGPTWGSLGAGAASSGGGSFVYNGRGLPPTGYPTLPPSSAY